MQKGIERQKEVDWKNVRIRRTKLMSIKEKVGEEAEEKVNELLALKFPEMKLIWDAYFETDNYQKNIEMYQTMQIDHILISEKAVYIIETKHLPKEAILKGSSFTKIWQYFQKDNMGKVHRHNETNADKQNYRHCEFISELLKRKIHMNVPVVSIVCLEGIEDENVKISLLYGHEVVCISELEDKIDYYESRFSGAFDKQKIYECIIGERIYDRIIPEIDDIRLKHLVYIRLMNRKSRKQKRDRVVG